jgi:transposase
MNTKRTYRTYSKAFREEALALISDQGYSVQAAADAVNVTTSLIHTWKQKK